MAEVLSPFARPDPSQRFDSFAKKLGVSFVPVSPQTKRPYHEEWTHRTFSESDFRPEDSVGGKWGDPSNGLVDIDGDDAYACRILRHVIKKGPCYGSPREPDGHHLVQCSGIKTKKFEHPIAHEMILEIRSTGSQSVLPPSPYQHGGYYTWRRQDELREITPAGLYADMAEVAAAALMASLWKGSRHEFALTLSGFLAKNKVSRERALRFTELITVGADDEEITDRLRCVNDTYDDYEKGEDIRANLGDHVPEHAAVVVKTLADWLGLERNRYKIHDEATLLARPAAPFLAKGLLVESSLVALVSKPDIGKTFLALDLVLSVAAKQPSWLGCPLLKHGPVVYVIGEGLGRFKLRVLAWKQMHGTNGTLPFHWIDQPIPLTDEGAVNSFLKVVAPLRPAVIVLDTLSRCLMGADENSQSDMGKAIAACDEFRARAHATVMLLHHMRKDGTVERGSSVLRGAVDTILVLEEEVRGLITLKCERQKDAEPFEPIKLVRRAIQLDGVCAEDGSPESSCVIRLASDGDVNALNHERESRLVDIVRANPGQTKTWLIEKVGGKKQDVTRLIEELETRGVLRIEKDGRAQRVHLANDSLPI